MITLPIWVFVILCILAAPLALIIVVFAALGLMVIITLIFMSIVEFFEFRNEDKEIENKQ